MATTQMVRQKPTQLTTTINKAQSLHLVQTMLHGALSSLTWIRGVFPDKAFVERYYETRQTPLPYADFAAGQMPAENIDTKSTKVYVLQRDCSKRVDNFLDWLESGVFPALASGELRAVRLLIHPDVKNRNLVLETYTFNFQYTDLENCGRTPSGLAMSSSSKAAPTGMDTTTALQKLLRKFNVVCEDFPALPNTRMMSMELVYYYEDGIDKIVTGFVPFKETDVSFRPSKGCDGSFYTRSLGFSTGYHETHLKITGSRKWRDPGTRERPDLPSMEILPHNTVSRSRDVKLMPLPRDVTPANHHTPSQMGKSREAERIQSPATPRNELDKSEEQSSLSKGMNSDLKGMMQPEQITQGDTQTQSALQPSVFEGAATVTPMTMRTSNTRTSNTTRAFSLTQDSWYAILKQIKKLGDRTKSIALSSYGRRIQCQCGVKMDEFDMLQCAVCSTFQHYPCYGYTGVQDPRRPDFHFCYLCLAGLGVYKSSYMDLQTLATKRFVMFHVAKNGLRTEKHLKLLLGYGTNGLASVLHAMVKGSDFVVEAAKSKKFGSSDTQKLLSVLKKDDASIRHLLKTYFDPMTNVSHHYDIRPDDDRDERDMETNVRLIRDLAKDDLLVADYDDDDDDDVSDLQYTPESSGLDMPPSQSFEATSETFQDTSTMATRGHSGSRKRGSEEEVTNLRAGKKLATPTTEGQRFFNLHSKETIKFERRAESEHAAVSRRLSE